MAETNFLREYKKSLARFQTGAFIKGKKAAADDVAPKAKRTTLPKRKKPIRPIGKKKAADMPQLNGLHDECCKRDEGLCQPCLIFDGKRTTATHANHIKTQGKFPELRFKLWNTWATCPKHNRMYSDKKSGLWGNVVEVAGGHEQTMGFKGKTARRTVNGAADSGWELKGNIF